MLNILLAPQCPVYTFISNIPSYIANFMNRAIISCLILPYFLNQNDRKDFTCLRVWKWLWIAWVVVFAIFAVFAMESSLSSDGEPITFLDGISVWPTELIRLFNGFLATYFFVISYQYVKRNSDEITTMLTDRNGKTLYPDIKKAFDEYEAAYEQWNWDWKKYGITGIIAIFHLVVGYGIIFLCGRPLTPGRGSLCLWMDRILLPSSLLLMFFFYWHVVLDMFNCQKLINKLINLKDKKYDYKCWYIVFKILAKKTEIHAKVVKYPFVLLLISCIARNNYFDNWKWTTPHAVIVTLSILLVLLTSMVLFHKIKVARRKVIDRLDSDLLELMEHTRKTLGKKCSSNLLVNVEFVKHNIKDIQDIKNGAFAPLGYNPILLSSLIPTGGMGVISLLQKYFQ